jgi:hypothetical protein
MGCVAAIVGIEEYRGLLDALVDTGERHQSRPEDRSLTPARHQNDAQYFMSVS